MNRRSFLKAIAAAPVAPYVITTAGVLMPVKKVLSAAPEMVAFVRSGTGAYSDPRTMQAALRDIINVRDFGAWGDGVQDDTMAFRHAIEAARQARKSIYVPLGNYNTSIVLPPEVGLYGDSQIVLTR